MKLMVSYVFRIPCRNGFAKTIFSHMNHLWSNYRNKMDIEPVEAELQIRKNSDIPCAQLFKFILFLNDLLKQITSNQNL